MCKWFHISGMDFLNYKFLGCLETMRNEIKLRRYQCKFYFFNKFSLNIYTKWPPSLHFILKSSLVIVLSQAEEKLSLGFEQNYCLCLLSTNTEFIIKSNPDQEVYILWKGIKWVHITCSNKQMNAPSFHGGRVVNRIHSFNRDQFR